VRLTRWEDVEGVTERLAGCESLLGQKSLGRGDRATPSEAPWAHPAGSRLSALAMLDATGFSGLTSRSSGAGLSRERGFRTRPPPAVFSAHAWRARPPPPRIHLPRILRRHHRVKLAAKQTGFTGQRPRRLTPARTPHRAGRASALRLILQIDTHSPTPLFAQFRSFPPPPRPPASGDAVKIA
jgi:hypothetical protein